MKVFVLDKHKKPLMPCSPKRARKLLESGRARVHKRYPFTIRIVDRTLEESAVQETVIKIDPGSKHTGIAVARRDDEKCDHALSLVQLDHRSDAIQKALLQRAQQRRSRRSRKTWYRAKRFNNRRRKDKWLAPSLQHRVLTTVSWVKRLSKLLPISSIEYERVSFDTQLMENPELSGIEYQRGTLLGTEVREYLYAKWGHRCVYCGKENVPLNLDHVIPKSKGGSNRVSNLVPSCRACNEAKDNKDIREYLKDKPGTLNRILSHLKAPLKDAAAMNSVRYALERELSLIGLPIRCYSGGRTKWNRERFNVPKDHALDALCVGDIEAVDYSLNDDVLLIEAKGHGTRQRTLPDKYGFPRTKAFPKQKRIKGFQTGDIVKATVPTNLKKGGVHIGRVAVRSTGRFNMTTKEGTIQGIGHQYCKLLQRSDGYSYSRKQIKEEAAFLSHPRKGVSCDKIL